MKYVCASQNASFASSKKTRSNMQNESEDATYLSSSGSCHPRKRRFRRDAASARRAATISCDLWSPTRTRRRRLRQSRSLGKHPWCHLQGGVACGSCSTSLFCVFGGMCVARLSTWNDLDPLQMRLCWILWSSSLQYTSQPDLEEQ